MKRIVITVCSDHAQDLYERVCNNRQRFALHHGCATRVTTILLGPDRPASWSKLLETQFAFSEGYDQVLWVDADAVITNLSFDWGDRLVPFRFACDENGINAGVYVANNLPRTLAIIEQAWQQRDLINHVWWEQAALTRVMTPSDYELVEKHKLNSYLHEHKAGDFTLHLAGVGPRKWDMLPDLYDQFDQKS